MNNYKESVEKLNQLLQKNIDSEKTYLKAAENVNSEVLKKFFHFQAEKRSKFVTDLTTEVLGLGGTPVETGSPLEVLERIWDDLSASVSRDNEEATLKACLAADKANLEEYKEIMHSYNVKTTAKDVLLKQRASIEATLNKIKNLEDVTVEFG